MPVPIRPNLSTSKTNFVSRPSVPADRKQSADEFNLIAGSIIANYDRLILYWSTDIAANTDLNVGQYVVFTDDILYRITTAYNVGSPITWNASNANALSGVDHFKGVFASEAALEAAFPTADEGDYALVDTGSADAQLFIWDETDTDWVSSGISTMTPIPAVDTTGTAIAFAVPQIYNSPESPATGNVTLNATGLVKGMTQVLYHNNGTAPTFGAEFKRISGVYVVSVLNIIYLNAISETRIEYTISQEL